MVKPVFYSDKMKKYYFNDNVFGEYRAYTVWGMEKIDVKPEDVKIAKNGKQYVFVELKREFSKESGKAYFKAVRLYVKPDAEKEVIEFDDAE